MLITNSTNKTDQINHFILNYKLLNHISNIIGYYALTAVALSGFLLNAIGVKILCNKILLKKHKFYKYILVKTVCDMLVCLTGIGYLNYTCLECIEIKKDHYGFMVYRYYFIANFTRLTLFSSAWSEVYLNYNRYSTLVGKKTWLTGISLKYYVPLLFGFPILLFLPIAFSISIKLYHPTNLYTVVLSKLGNSALFSFYYLLVFVLESILPIILLLVLSILNINEFKKFMRKKMVKSNDGQRKIKLAEIKFTKVILVLTFLFVLARLFDLLSGILYRLISIGVINYSQVVFSIINFVRQASYFIEFFNYMICIFMLASIDQNFSFLIKSLLMKILIIKHNNNKIN